MCGYYFGFVVLSVAVKGLQLRFCHERKLDVCVLELMGLFFGDESVCICLRYSIEIAGMLLLCKIDENLFIHGVDQYYRTQLGERGYIQKVRISRTRSPS